MKKKLAINSVVNMKENVDIEEAIDKAGHGRYNLCMLVTCCIINVGAVVDMLGYSLVVPAASCDLNLTLEQGGVLKSISFAGFIFALPWGYITDTRGRRRAILVSCTVGFIITAMTSLSTSFYMMLVLKFLASSFSGASMTLTIAYLGESTSMAHRNRYLFVQSIACMGADLVAFGLAYICFVFDFEMSVPLIITYKPWRLLVFVHSLPLGIGAMMMYFFQESPKFLANKGETEEALQVLRTIFKANYGNGAVYPVKSLMKTDKVNPATSFWESVVKQTFPVFKPPLLWRSMQLFLLLSICCATNNVFIMWFPTMVNSFFSTGNEDIGFCQKIVAKITPYIVNGICIDNSSMNTIYSGMLFSVLFTIINVAAIAVADWRRSLMTTCFFICAVCCITVHMVRDATGSMVIFIMIQLTGICIGSVYSYYVDLFPTSYRGLATSLGMMVTRFVCLGGVNLIGATITNHCELTFYCWAVFIFSGIVAVMFLPENNTRHETSIDKNIS